MNKWSRAYINEGRALYLYMEWCAAVTYGSTQFHMQHWDTIQEVSVGLFSQHHLSENHTRYELFQIYKDEMECIGKRYIHYS